MKKIIPTSFFNRPTTKVAKELLGMFLVRKVRGREVAHMITEVEAYDGFSDKASHAARGRTKRNEVMFAEAGTIYVYFTYGMHWMLNVVTGEKEYPAAILIRGVEGISGPARLTKALKIDKKFNTKKLGRKTGLWIEDRGVEIKKSDIRRTPRVGVAYAGPVWARRPYRFVFMRDQKRV
ncbi:MAG: DNA-3-methyladenine glycosylase [Parcubacteria group bacterium]|nr:DNA-3-methyladenine glycosylase [Parcubacteria group bacterium]